jgi:hypothetical protein
MRYGMRYGKKYGTRFAVVLILLGAAGLLAACRGPLVVETAGSHRVPGAGEGDEREWTVAVYMSGDNELEAEALADLSEMEAADLGEASISVVVLLDRAEGYDGGAGDWSGTRLYEVEANPLGDASTITSRRLGSPRLGIEADADVELNTGDPRSLARFLAFVAAEFPAPNTALVVWGPGAGYSAVSVDDGNGGDPLATAELAEALETHPPDILALDLAFGAQIEIAREVDGSARTLIASQQTVGTAGWDYTRFLEALAAAPAGDRAAGEEAAVEEAAVEEAAASSYAEAYADTPGACISVIELAAVGEVSRALDALSRELHASADSAPARDTLRRLLFEEVEDFYRTPGDLNLDIADLAETVSASHPEVSGEAERVELAVEHAVSRSWCSSGANDRARGLSVHYVPIDAGGYAYPPHADHYFAGRTVETPLRFVSESAWVPDEVTAAGLLYRLWYEAMP